MHQKGKYSGPWYLWNLGTTVAAQWHRWCHRCFVARRYWVWNLAEVFLHWVFMLSLCIVWFPQSTVFHPQSKIYRNQLTQQSCLLNVGESVARNLEETNTCTETACTLHMERPHGLLTAKQWCYQMCHHAAKVQVNYDYMWYCAKVRQVWKKF